MLCLELAELAHEVVVLEVADARLVEHEVAVVGLVDPLAQLGDATLGRGHAAASAGATSAGRSNWRSGRSARSASRGKMLPQRAAAEAVPAARAACRSNGESPT